MLQVFMQLIICNDYVHYIQIPGTNLTPGLVGRAIFGLVDGPSRFLAVLDPKKLLSGKEIVRHVNTQTNMCLG